MDTVASLFQNNHTYCNKQQRNHSILYLPRVIPFLAVFATEKLQQICLHRIYGALNNSGK